jgi:hypothetical protein
MCQICLTIFLTHGVPNTQVKPTEDNCEAYFTQHVSNVTLCQYQIYSVQYRKKKFSLYMKAFLHFEIFVASVARNVCLLIFIAIATSKPIDAALKFPHQFLKSN